MLIDRVVGSRIIALVILLVLGVTLAGCGQSADEAELDRRKKVAGELRDSKLYEAAIAEYNEILNAEGLSDGQRGSVAYLIGKVYFEDVKDFENAAAYYVRARALDPDGSFMAEASRNLVVALEKSGRYLDAKRELENVTDLDATDSPRGSIPVAIISGDTVWLAELEIQIQSLPAEFQKQMLTVEAKRQFLRQYIGIELVAQSAIREGLDRDPDFLLRRETMVKKLLMEKYIAERIMPQLSMEPSDIRNFYEANQEKRYQNQKFEAIAERVARDYRTEKSAMTYMEHIARLAKIEKVVFLDQNIK